MLALFYFLSVPSTVIVYACKFGARCVRRWMNGLWLGCRTFWAELDVATLDFSLDLQLAVDQVLEEHRSAGWSLGLYLFKAILFHYFDPMRFLFDHAPALAVRVRVVNGFGISPKLRLMRTALRRFVADTGATHHCAFKPRPGDSIGA